MSTEENWGHEPKQPVLTRESREGKENQNGEE
jgi:hypothetical protein